MSDGDRSPGVGDGPEIEHRVRGSRFVGRAFAVTDEDEAAGCLREIRRAHHAATHHCWALRLGPDEPTLERHDDGGEPAGTAGAPILALLHGRGLCRTLVVVTRYFGGTKLGTGGLARAYGEAAALAVDAAPPRTLVGIERFDVVCGWAEIGAVEAVLARRGEVVRGVERDFGDRPRLRVTAERSSARALASEIIEATAARARIENGIRGVE